MLCAFGATVASRAVVIPRLAARCASMSEPPPVPGAYYQRPLPEPPCIDFLGQRGREVFEEALRNGGMECFFPLVAQFRTQDEPAFCGLGTLVMVLNALRVDPGKSWKGVWRWYDEQALSCCKDTAIVEREGVTLDEFVCLARCNALTAQAQHAQPGSTDEGGVDAFRTAVKHAATHANAVLCASYDRQGLGQTGSGHFSPIAGYHAREDLVLILDVARFKYPPHWVSLSVLHAAMQAQDASTGRPRGWVTLARADATSEPTEAHRCCAAGDTSDEMNEKAHATLMRVTDGQVAHAHAL